ncbi:hypothetical protein MRB53_001198 [Persea americana]|uniref:Uncharacterized protein n=3 Tax=Persea americana TaxID=3435 RepID=A0ACC2MR29_PERAE|nr:hypothetical protein MRB53_001195 [Persea americana]KAJ8648173.1 hypothetical protein MRB53_001196 [Persea americana]KAJ8648175.1 hypothetical protein MRB53_001198 [Persea americana]
MHPQRIRHFQLSSSQRGGRLEIAALPPMGTAVKLPFPDFLLSEGSKAGNCSFTADGNGGKAAISRFPPLGQEENWKCSFTADESSGKAAIARFPPLRVEENWKMRVCRRCRQR